MYNLFFNFLILYIVSCNVYIKTGSSISLEALGGLLCLLLPRAFPDYIDIFIYDFSLL